MTGKIRDWTIKDQDDGQGPALVLTKPGREHPVIIFHERGMDRDVLLEYATTRALEAELRDAGAEVTVDPTGEVAGTTGKATKTLIEEYRSHVVDSRDAQELRERKRMRAMARGE